MSKRQPRGKPKIRRDGRAASRTGGHRRSKFQPWRLTNGKTSPVRTRKIGEDDR